jgi:hypothetical protein
VIDLAELTALCGFVKVRDFQKAHRQWVEEARMVKEAMRDYRWSESIAVGSLPFVENVKSELGIKVLHREFEQFGGAYVLREPSEPYTADLDSASDALRLKTLSPRTKTLKLQTCSVVRPMRLRSGRRANLKKRPSAKMILNLCRSKSF